jgi:hypothetical protein
MIKGIVKIIASGRLAKSKLIIEGPDINGADEDAAAIRRSTPIRFWA